MLVYNPGCQLTILDASLQSWTLRVYQQSSSYYISSSVSLDISPLKFSSRNLPFCQFAKVFSLESFPLYGISLDISLGGESECECILIQCTTHFNLRDAVSSTIAWIRTWIAPNCTTFTYIIVLALIIGPTITVTGIQCTHSCPCCRGQPIWQRKWLCFHDSRERVAHDIPPGVCVCVSVCVCVCVCVCACVCVCVCVCVCACVCVCECVCVCVCEGGWPNTIAHHMRDVYVLPDTVHNCTVTLTAYKTLRPPCMKRKPLIG